MKTGFKVLLFRHDSEEMNLDKIHMKKYKKNIRKIDCYCGVRMILSIVIVYAKLDALLPVNVKRIAWFPAAMALLPMSKIFWYTL